MKDGRFARIAGGFAMVALLASGELPVYVQAQEAASAPRGPSPPQNAGSQRYEINQTFGGQAYFKDNNVWVYDKDFADLFGMPVKYIEGLEGATAAAFRLEEAPYRQCGFGGRDEACMAVDLCYLDLYFDESKTPLPWANESRHAWVPQYSSMRWLRPQSRQEKPYGMTAPDTPSGVVRNEVLLSPLVAFADPASNRQAIFTSNVGDPKAGPEEVSGGSMAVLGYSRMFYKTLSIVSLQFGCSPFSRNSINVRLDARRDVYGPPIARFNRISLPPGFVKRIGEVIEARRQRNTDFYRSLFPPPLGTKSSSPASSLPN